MGHRNAPRTEPNCSSCVKKKEKTGGGGRGKKKSFPCRFDFSGDIWRITQPFFLVGGGGGKGEQERESEFDGHSGPYRKVTFERTMAGLFGHVRCYE